MIFADVKADVKTTRNKESQGIQAFAFCEVTVNDEHT